MDRVVRRRVSFGSDRSFSFYPSPLFFLYLLSSQSGMLARSLDGREGKKSTTHIDACVSPSIVCMMYALDTNRAVLQKKFTK